MLACLLYILGDETPRTKYDCKYVFKTVGYFVF